LCVVGDSNMTDAYTADLSDMEKQDSDSVFYIEDSDLSV
jgi:hypothetical protein